AGDFTKHCDDNGTTNVLLTEDPDDDEEWLDIMDEGYHRRQHRNDRKIDVGRHATSHRHHKDSIRISVLFNFGSAIILEAEKSRNCDPDSGDGILQTAQVSRAMEIIHNSLVLLCDNIAATFQLTRHQLGYEAAPKSLYAGNIQVTRIGDRRPPEETVGNEIVTLIPGLDRIKNVRPGENVQFIIIIEKQGVFSNLLDLGFTTDKRLGPSIMICPKGQSDIASHYLYPEIVRRQVPFYIFTDCDPAGADIALTFKNEWLGVSIEDLKNFPNSHSLILRLTQTERSK
ncbi:hypothetical protein PSHT_14922, partial [Puccinia striiformis]